MSTTERREVYTTKTVKTYGPQKVVSKQNVKNLDNNLDNLLEDLQNTVSRPGSSLDKHYTQTYVQESAHPTTYLTDEFYDYKVAESNNSNIDIINDKRKVNNNVNKLDTILHDLQQTRPVPADSKHMYEAKKSVHRELVYSDNPQRGVREGSASREIHYVNDDLNEHIRPIQHNSLQRGTTQNVKLYNYSTESRNEVDRKAEVLESTNPDINPTILSQLDPTLLPPPNTKVTTTIKTYTYEIPGSGYPSAVSPKPNDSSYASSLSPASPKLIDNSYAGNISTPSQSFTYNKVESNTASSNLTNVSVDYLNPVSPAQKSVYGSLTTPNKETHVYKENTKVVNQIGFVPRERSVSPRPPERQVYNETTTTVNNHYCPNCCPHSPQGTLKSTSPMTHNCLNCCPNSPHGTLNSTTTMNTMNTLNSMNTHYCPNCCPNPHGTLKGTTPISNHYCQNCCPHSHGPMDPKCVHHTYVVNETNTTTRNVTGPPYPKADYPPEYTGNPPNTTIVYKTDNYTTHYGSPKQPPYTDSPNTRSGPPYGNDNRPYDPRDDHHPREPVNITYKYTTHHTSSNNYRGRPNEPESEPLLQPMPFPTGPNDRHDIDGPPKKLDELMAVIGNEPPNNAYNAGYNAKEIEREHQKKDQKNTTVELQKRDIKDLPKSKNVAGPPVYYPPGHEMFSSKEEYAAGSRSEGGMMKESGKYQYEAKSSSKTKSSSGMAVVPVCLPLCCGLPCVIM